MAESNRNFSQRPPGEGNEEEGPDEASNIPENPCHPPGRVARPVHEETPAAHAQPTGFPEIPRHGRPSRRLQRQVAYINARVLAETTSTMQAMNYFNAAEMPHPVRRNRNRGPLIGAPSSYQVEFPPLRPPFHPHPRGSAAYNAYVPPRQRFRGPIGRYANSHFGPGQHQHNNRQVHNRPFVHRCDHHNDHPDHVSEDSGIVATDNPAPPRQRNGGSRNAHRNPEPPRFQNSYRFPYRGHVGEQPTFRRPHQRAFYTNYTYHSNPQPFYQPASYVPQVQESAATPLAREEEPLEPPATVSSQFSHSYHPVYEPACSPTSEIHEVAGPSDLEPSVPYYEDGGTLCPYHSAVVDYGAYGPAPYTFDQVPVNHPTSMFVPPPPVTYSYTSAPQLEPPPYLPYYSSPPTSYSQVHNSISYPYTYPYTGNFFPHSPRPYHPFHETTYYPQNPPIGYFYPQPPPAMHYPVYPPSNPYQSYPEVTEQNVVPIRLDPPAEARASPSSEGHGSQASTPPSGPLHPRNLQLLPPERTSPETSANIPTTEQSSFTHTFVPSTRHPHRNIPPPFTYIGISSESRRRQISGNLYYFCDIAGGAFENQLDGPEYFLYECSTCPSANQPCQQWVMVSPRGTPMTTPMTVPTTRPQAPAHAEGGGQSHPALPRGDFDAGA